MVKALLKKQFSSMLFSIVRGGKTKTKSKGNTILMLFLYLYVCVAMCFMFFSMMEMMAGPLVSVSLDWLYFLYAVLLGTAASMLLGLFMVQSSLYEAKDNELVFSLPIPPRYILMCRMVPLYVQNLLISALVIVPAYVAYAKAAPIKASHIIAAVALVIFISFLSLAICCVLGFLLATISDRIRKKNLVQIVFSLSFLAAYFYVYSQANKYIQRLITGSTEIAEKARTYLYLFCKAGEGGAGDYKSLLIFIGITVAVFAIIYAILSATYIKIITNKRGAAKVKYVEKQLKVSTLQNALFKKELKRFFGSSIYLMNTGLGTIFLLVGTVAAIIKGDWLVGMINQLYPIDSFLPLIATFAVSMICATNNVAAPSISLEGKNMWLLQSLPISPFTLIMQKFRLHFLVTAPASVILTVTLSIVAKMSPLQAVFMIIIPVLVTTFNGFFGLFCNILKPNFKWNTETEVVKQSASVTIAMFGSWGTLMLFAIAYLTLGDKIPTIAYLIAPTVIYATADILLFNYLKTKGAAKLAHIS